jgi:hypothetical protein
MRTRTRSAGLLSITASGVGALLILQGAASAQGFAPDRVATISRDSDAKPILCATVRPLRVTRWVVRQSMVTRGSSKA